MEIFGFAARDIAAFWGAILSTWLAVTKLLHPRPIVMMDFTRDRERLRDVRLQITNPASYPVMLIKVRTLIGGEFLRRESIEGWKTIDLVTYNMSGRLNLLIPAGASKKMTHYLEEKPRDGLMFVLFWRSHRSIPWPMLPSIIYRSKAAVRALADHPATEEN
jgi:hypothetical protein